MQCPLCRSRTFYVKDPDDPYELYRFDVTDGRICFEPELDPAQTPEIREGTETWCDKCAWHGNFNISK